MTRGDHEDDPTPLARKLGVREGSHVLVVGAPKGFSLVPLPPDVRIARRARGTLDVVVLFVERTTELRRRFATLSRALDVAGRLWVAWPKKTAGVATDLTFGIVQQLGLSSGLVDNKSAAIDEVYQGLQFVYRLKDRPKGRRGG